MNDPDNLYSGGEEINNRHGLNRRVLPFEPWMDLAYCYQPNLEHVTEIFFSSSSRDQRVCLKFCAACTVRIDCLDYAIRYKIDDGIWGGMAARVRRQYVATMKTRVALPKLKALAST